MAGQTINISVLADSSKFQRSMDKLGGRMQGVARNLGRATLAGVAVVGAGIALIAGSAFSAVAELERLNAQTTAALESTGGAAGRTLDQITELAGGLERLTGVEAEVIQAGQNMLLTFTNIQGVQFDQATAAALDMSVALGTDLTQSALMVGKALNDPIQGISALRRVGVQLTEQQESQIRQMVEMGDVAGAQTVILGELQRQFGGSAEAFGSTFLGGVEKIKNEIGAISEAFVVGLLPAATETVQRVAALLADVADSPALAALVEQINDFVLGLVNGQGATSSFGEVLGQLVAGFSPLSIVVQSLAPVLPMLGEAFATLGDALVGMLPSLAALSTALVEVFSGVLAAVLPPLLVVVAALADSFAVLLPPIVAVAEVVASVLAEALVALAPLFTTLATVVADVLAAALPAVTPLLETLAEIVGVLGEALAPLVPMLVQVAETLALAIGDALVAVSPLLVVLAEIIGQLLTAVAPFIGALLELATPLLALLDPLLQLVGALLPPLIELVLAIVAPILEFAGVLLSALMPALTFIIDVLATLIGWVAAALTWFVNLVTGAGSSGRDLQRIFNNIGNFISSTWSNIVGFFRNGVTSALQFFRNLGNDLWGIVTGIGTRLYNAGRSIVQSLIDGVRSMFSAVGSAFGGIMDFAAGFFPNSPAKRGAFSGSGWTKIRQAGQAIQQQFVGGLGSVGTALMSGGDLQLGASIARHDGAAAVGNVYNITVQTLAPNAEVGRAVVDAIAHYERFNGKRLA